jgi:hypothetical protein
MLGDAMPTCRSELSAAIPARPDSYVAHPLEMFGPNGNPSAKNLFGVLAHLQAQEGVNFEIRPRRG